MSRSQKPIQELGNESDTNKPDFKELDLNLFTPIRKSSVVNTSNCNSNSNSSGSSSSGSFSGKPPTSHSGELTGTCAKKGHRRSASAGAPLIYSGNSSGSCSSSSSSSATIFSAGTSSISSKHNNNPINVVLQPSGNICPSGKVAKSASISSNLHQNYGPLNTNASATSSNSQNGVVLQPSGNICPSGKIMKSSIMGSKKNSVKTDVLRSGTGNYGHGSIIRGGGGGGGTKQCSDNVEHNLSIDPEEMKMRGNELYRKGSYLAALVFYDRAISISPDNAAYRSNRGAALMAMGRLGEAIVECEEAVRLDPGYWRAHQRLASLYLRLGQIENIRCHLSFPGQQPDQAELQKLLLLEKHLNRCVDARKIGDWKSALRECNAAISAGADSCPQLIACRAEALLKLHQLDDAICSISNIPKHEPHSIATSQTRFCGMLVDAYILFVQAHMEMALGRFENAVSLAEKSQQMECGNVEISKFLNNVKLVTRARARGNDLFSSGRFTEACSAYGEGLKYDTYNSVLFCNRAVCWSKMGLWEQCIEDCNQALKIQPNHPKALLRRAASNAKLERWIEAVRDYEVLKRELPGDNEVSESLFSAQVALKKSRGELVNGAKFSGEVEDVSNLEQFKAAISSHDVSVVHFRLASDPQCEQISPFINTLCLRYSSINFLKVDIDECPILTKAENIRTVPTFKIYKNGSIVKEMICPSYQVLESSVKHYSL